MCRLHQRLLSTNKIQTTNIISNTEIQQYYKRDFHKVFDEYFLQCILKAIKKSVSKCRVHCRSKKYEFHIKNSSIFFLLFASLFQVFISINKIE
jgi:hypothetical protein